MENKQGPIQISAQLTLDEYNLLKRMLNNTPVADGEVCTLHHIWAKLIGEGDYIDFKLEQVFTMREKIMFQTILESYPTESLEWQALIREIIVNLNNSKIITKR